MPISEQTLNNISNPTHGGLGKIGNSYQKSYLLASENRRANEKRSEESDYNQVKTALGNANLNEAEYKNLITESKIVNAVSEQFMNDTGKNPNLLRDPAVYNEYMMNLTGGLPEDVVNNFKGILPNQIPKMYEKTGLILKAFQDQTNKYNLAPDKKTVTTRVDPKTNIAYRQDILYNRDGTEQYRSPEYADVDVTAETDLTDSQKGKELINFQDAAIASLNVIDVATEAINAVRTAPEAAGYAGNILSGINEVTNTVNSLVSTIRPDVNSDTVKIGNGENAEVINRDELGDRYSEELSKFRNSAIWSQELDAMLVNLGYMAAMAKGQTGRGLSDIDLKMNMKEVGKTTDPAGVERLIRKFTKRTIQQFKNKALVKGKNNSEYVDMVDKRLIQFDKLWSTNEKSAKTLSDKEIMNELGLDYAK